MTALPASAGRCDTRSRPEGFALAGPTQPLDPRIHAFRNDLADIALAGRRFAPHYASVEDCGVTASSAMVMPSPAADAPGVSQLMRGEGFAMLDRSGGWAWGRCAHDGYVGYVRADALGAPVPATHRVIAPRALVFAAPSIKARITACPAIGTRLSGTVSGEFVRVTDGYLHHRHVAPLDRIESDWTATAERLVGLPYLWGGRGADGIDCSGLVQVALGLAGRSAPRDSDQQRDALGEALDEADPLHRGDLVFFPGHVGIMVDGERIVHANAWWMAVTIEPLADVVARLADRHVQPILGRRRIVA